MDELAKIFHGPAQMALHGLTAPPFWLAFAGVALAWYMYMYNPALSSAIKRIFQPIYIILENKYYLDWFNEKVLTRGIKILGVTFWKFGDQKLIDGVLVNGSWKLVSWVSNIIRRLQSGYIYHYAFGMIIGVLILMTYFVWFSK